LLFPNLTQLPGLTFGAIAITPYPILYLYNDTYYSL
jgi:hypothetical protein